MHRPGRSNISARLTSFAPSSSQRMWEPINPSERDSFAREIADLPRSFNRDRDSFIIFFDALGIFYPEREEERFKDSLVCVKRLFFNLSRTFKNEDEEDSPFRVIVPEFLYSSIIYLLFSSLEISTKILEKRTRKRRGERIDPPTPPSLFHTARLHKAWIRKWNFFSSSRKRNLFIEGIHSSESWAREQRFSIGVEERKRWIGDEKRVSNARALPPRGGESQTTSPPLQRFLLPSPIPFSFHRVKNLGDFSTSSAHVAAPLKGEPPTSPETRSAASPPCAFRGASTSPTTFARAFCCVCTHHVPLPLVHTQVSHGKCQFAERTILGLRNTRQTGYRRSTRQEKERETERGASFVLRGTV